MRSERTLRRWPTRNFLAELDAPQRDRYAIDDLARREPRIRRAQRLLRAAARSIDARMLGPDWIRYRDAAMALQLAIFEVELAPIRWTPGLCRFRHPAVVGLGLVRGPVAVV